MREDDFIVDMEHEDKNNQLTPKGLSLLMYIFAQKEENANQPVVAGNIASLERVVGLIDDSEPGTELTVIFTASTDTDDNWTETLGKKKYGRDFSSFHKTSLTLRKGLDGKFEVVHLDSISGNTDLIEIPNKLILKALEINAVRNNREPTKMLSYEPVYPDDESRTRREFNGQRYVEEKVKFARQRDKYNCGVYAVKDARYLTRNPTLDLIGKASEVEMESGMYECQKFSATAAMIRSTQVSPTFDLLKSGKYDLKAPVNRKGAPLVAFLDKYTQAGNYIDKFGRKYLAVVENVIEKNGLEESLKFASHYNCENITNDDIARINQARQMPKAPGAQNH
jgi:hypothetical protein